MKQVICLLILVAWGCGGNSLPKKEADDSKFVDSTDEGDASQHDGVDSPDEWDEDDNPNRPDTPDVTEHDVAQFVVTRVEVAGVLTPTRPVLLRVYIDHPDGAGAIDESMVYREDATILGSLTRTNDHFQFQLDWLHLNPADLTFEVGAVLPLMFDLAAGEHHAVATAEVSVACDSDSSACEGICGMTLCENSCDWECGPNDPDPDPDPQTPDWLSIPEHCSSLPTGSSNNWTEANLNQFSPMWDRPLSCPGTVGNVDPARYQAIRFCNDTGARGVWSFDLYPLDDTNPLDPYLVLYDGPAPANSLMCSVSDDDSGDGLNSRIVREIPAGGSVIAMMTVLDDDPVGNIELHVREVE